MPACQLLSSGRDAVAQLVERPSKVPVWCNSTDVGLNHLSQITPRFKVVWEKLLAKKILASPAVSKHLTQGFGKKLSCSVRCALLTAPLCDLLSALLSALLVALQSYLLGTLLSYLLGGNISN